MDSINMYVKNPYVSNSNVINNDLNTNGVSDAKNNSDSGKSFMDILGEKLNEVNDKQVQADNVTQSYIKGDESDISNVMISTEEAKMSLEMAVQVRNKIVEAYQEISRMQL